MWILATTLLLGLQGTPAVGAEVESTASLDRSKAGLLLRVEVTGTLDYPLSEVRAVLLDIDGFRRWFPAVGTWQILEQIYVLEELRGERCTNVVFMGMGEPFHNYDAVIGAAGILIDTNGAGLGARRVTISTAGVLPGIERFTDEGQPFRLALSLNHSDGQGRSEIMSINRRYPLHHLLEAARRYTATSGRRITFEYVMITGVNMSEADGRRLARIGRSMPCVTAMAGLLLMVLCVAISTNGSDAPHWGQNPIHLAE